MNLLQSLQPKSLFGRFFLVFVVTLTVSALALVLVLPRQMEDRMVAIAEQDTLQKIQSIRPVINLYLGGRLSYAEMNSQLDTLERLLGGQLYVVNHHGMILVSSPGFGSELHQQYISDEDYEALLQGQQITRREADGNILTIAVPIVGEVLAFGQGVQQLFFGALYLQMPVEAVLTTALVARRQVAMLPLIVTSIAFITAGLISRSLGRPLARMSHAALHMAQGEYAIRISDVRDDELGRLGQSFNHMAESLESSMRSLKEERDRISNLVYALTEGVIATDVQQEVLLLNPAAATYLQLNLDDTLGKPLAQLPLPESLRVHLTSDSLAPQSATFALEEQTVLRVTTSPLSDDQGRFAAQVAVLQDITQDHLLEEQRKAFVANVSHELRTPLTSIQGFVEGMLDQTIPPEQRDRYLNIIHQESVRLTKLIYELLELSHIESGQLQLHLEAIELAPLLQSILLRTSIASGREDVVFQVQLSPEKPVIIADADCLEQILINLLSNAIKFTPQGGTVQVRSYLADSPEEKLVIEVLDSGAGIDEENLPFIWDRFFKADKSRSSKGSGLGLSIVRSLVETHKESIWVENRPPLGACFAFTLPLNRTP